MKTVAQRKLLWKNRKIPFFLDHRQRQEGSPSGYELVHRKFPGSGQIKKAASPVYETGKRHSKENTYIIPEME